MKKSMVVALILITLAGCGGDDKSPTSPATTGPTNIAGVWVGTGTSNSVTPASHPVALTLAPYLGSSPISVSVSQSGSELTIRMTDTTSGQYTDYLGTIGSSAFTADWTYSSAAVITGVQCVDNVVRDLHIHTDNISGSLSGTTLSGTVSTAYNCVVSGTQQADGVVVVRSSFSVSKSK